MTYIVFQQVYLFCFLGHPEVYFARVWDNFSNNPYIFVMSATVKGSATSLFSLLSHTLQL